MRTYAWEDEYGIFWLCVDDTRFANHSETPSCKSWFNGAFWMDSALRDIKKGEEITYNYRDFHKGKTL
jgi:SET domain-containing protein